MTNSRSDLCITKDETIRRITVYAPDAEELSKKDAVKRAIQELGHPFRWAVTGYDRTKYNRVTIIFETL